MAKIAYFVMSHVNPEQVARLVRALRSSNSESWVVIHHDYSTSQLDPQTFNNIDNVHMLEQRTAIEWGGFSIIRTILNAIDWFLHGQFDWMVYISGQDYPIMPLQQIEQFLDTTEYDGFVSAHRADASELPEAVFPQWYFYHWYFYRIYKFKIPSTLVNLIHAQKIKSGSSTLLNEPLKRVLRPDHILPLFRIKYSRPNRQMMFCLRPLSTPFTPTFHCYHGSNWWTLSRRSIQYLHQFTRENSDFLRYYQHTHVPDESFFQTILLNNPSLNISDDDKRYIRWDKKPAPHPAVLTAKDFPHLVSSGKHFARKLDQTIDAQLFDLLDQHITQPAHTLSKPKKSEPHQTAYPLRAMQTLTPRG